MVLEGVESDVHCTVRSANSIWVVPLANVSTRNGREGDKVKESKYLEILSHTVPEINSLEIWVVAIIEGTAVVLEFVRELDSNLVLNASSRQKIDTHDKVHGLAIDRFPRLG